MSTSLDKDTLQSAARHLCLLCGALLLLGPLFACAPIAESVAFEPPVVSGSFEDPIDPQPSLDGQAPADFHAPAAQHAPVVQQAPAVQMTPVSQQEPLRISFVAAGDNLIHEPIYSYHEGFDYSDLYASVRPLIETADVAYVNQESICGGEELGLSGRFPRFNSPSGILDALAASGFDWVGTANNHTLDFGAEGVLSQLARIEELGLTQSGTAASPSAAQQPTVILVQGVRIGLANYTLSTNGIVGPPGSEYLVATLTPRSSGLQFEDGADQASFLAPPLSPASTLRLLTDLRQLEAVSDLQIVSMHWGEEGDHMPNAQQRALARLLADNGVDAIIGSHPHVVQPLEFIATAQGAQVPVAWSLGNFLSAQQQPEELRGALAHWTFVYDPQTGETKIEDARLVAIHTRISADDHGYFVSPG